jgi:mono/diheme cytochrome c family protein
VRSVVAWIGAAVAILLFVVWAAVLRNGLAANRAPGTIETIVARQLVRLSIPARDRERPNPYAADSNAWRPATDHFLTGCAVCHGDDGHGTAVGRSMYPPVPDLADDWVQKLPDGALFALIQNGVRWTGMPAFGEQLDEDATWHMVALIRHLPQETSSQAAMSDTQ